MTAAKFEHTAECQLSVWPKDTISKCTCGATAQQAAWNDAIESALQEVRDSFRVYLPGSPNSFLGNSIEIRIRRLKK